MTKKNSKLPEFYWNNRVVQYPDGTFAIHEAHYDQVSKRQPHSITLDAVGVYGDDKKQLRETLERMLRALDKPALKYRTYVKKKDDNKKWRK